MLQEQAATSSRAPSSPPRPDRPIALLTIAAALAVAVVALVGWRIWPAVTTSSGEAIHRDVMAAWNTGDVDAARSLYAPDAIVQLSNFDRPLAEGIDNIVAEVEYQAQVGFVVERTGPVTESEGLVSAPVHISTDADAYGDDAIVVLVVSGEGKIVEHWTIWGGSGS